MSVIEPRVVYTREVSKTLTYHVDLAKRTMHEAR